jgi:large subunit ribosomal protein L19
MSINAILERVQSKAIKAEVPEFDIGDSVDVHYRILEGDKERIQIFSGIVIARRGGGVSETFTVRKIVDGEGVERIFPLHSPKVADIEVKRRAKVRRAKLYYLRDRVGKQAVRLKERIINEKTTKGRARTKIKARKEKAAAAASAPVAAAPAEKPKKRNAGKKVAKKADAKS